MKIWKKSYQEILFFLCGNYGFLCFWERMSGIEVWEGVVCLWMLVFAGALWYFYFSNRKWLGAAAGAAGAAMVVVIAVGRVVLLQQIGHIWHAFTGIAGMERQNVTFLFLIIMTFVMLLLFFIEMIWRNHAVSCLLTAIMLIMGPVLGISSGYKAIFFLILFQLSFLMDNLKKETGILTVIIFAAVFLLVSFNQERLYHAAYQAEHFVHNTMMYLTGKADEAVADGHINRGNDYKTGTVQMELETYVLPTETLYLNGFSGNHYTGGEWIRDDDTKLLEQAAQELGLLQRRNALSTMFGGMYYTLNSFLSGDGIVNSRNINIKHVSGKYGNYFKPYGGQWMSGAVYSTYAYTGYDYRYYEQRDLKIDWNRVRAPFANQAEWYANLQNAYMEAVGRECVDVPREKLPNLTKLCETYPLEGFDEITAFITTTLRQKAFYTQMPGNAPLNKDIVEYFLFESGKGYCQHFASAATLMYRIYGVPARYATGYMVEPSDFQLEKGVYKAYVTDESAHAWVEVFIKDYGWVPIEVTPGADGNIQTVYPGIDLAEWERALEQYQWDLDINFTMPEEDDLPKTDEGVWEWSSVDWEKYLPLLRIAMALVLYTILLTPLFVKNRRFRYLERFNEMGCCAHFNRFVQMLHYAGYLTDCNGMEEDFAVRLAEQFPSAGVENITNMVCIVEKAAYGKPDTVSKMEEVFVKELCRDFSKQIYNGLKWYQKWIFQYGKMFC